MVLQCSMSARSSPASAGIPGPGITGACRSGRARKIDLVIINDVELAVFVFPEDLDEVIDERVMIVNDKYIFYF